MGLMDILSGMQNGPRGPSDPNDKSGGMSPMTMAILAMLAYKGYKHLSANQNPATRAPSPQPQTQTADGGGLGGVLGNIFGGNRGAPSAGGGGLGGMLGGLLAGGAAGSVLSGGLGDLMKQFQQHGQGDAVNSWVGTGPNKQIAPGDLATALGAEQIDQLTSRTGMSRDELLSELSHELPGAVDHFTPDGRVPTEHEMSRWV